MSSPKRRGGRARQHPRAPRLRRSDQGRTGHGHSEQGRSEQERLERIIYGRHPVREAARGRRKVRAIHATVSAADHLKSTLDRLQSDGVRINFCEAFELDELAQSRDHQGVVAEVESYPYVDTATLLAKAKRDGVSPLILCLDGITDPHNLGAIARVCDAAGATGLLIPEHRSARVTAAAVKASAGALEHVLVAKCTNLAKEINRIKNAELWAYAATERGEVSWTDIDLASGGLIILGAEGPGVRPGVLAACDQEVMIPMSGAVASLNVSTVAAILAFEAVRQRQKQDQSQE